MLKLPLHLVAAELDLFLEVRGALIKSSFSASGLVKSLEALPADSLLVLKLALTAESKWIAPYFTAIAQSFNSFNFSSTETLLLDYYQGLMLAAKAHASALKEQQARLANISPLLKLKIEHTQKEELAQSVAKWLNLQQNSLSDSLNQWISSGIRLFLAQYPCVEGEAEPIQFNTQGQSVAFIACSDYLTHLKGDSLMAPKQLMRPSLLTLLTTTEQQMLLRA